MNNDNQTTVIQMPPGAPEVNPFAERAAQEAAKPKKASILSQVTVRKRRRPVMALLYGQPGIGKSTWASAAPKPIFISTERGLDQLNCHRLPSPKDFKALYEQGEALANEEHEYQTIVLDTVDGADLLVQKRVCDEYKCKSIGDPPYGGGYQRARELWTGLLNKFTEMNERFNIILIAHSSVKVFTDPSLSAPYDTWQLRLQERSSSILYQAVDTILFVNLDTTIQKDSPKARKGKGIVSGDRLLWTEPGTGYIAKNRFNFPNPMPFEWAALEQAISEFYNQ
jgi:hypothetical protein